MAWSSTLTQSVLISKTSSKSRYYRVNVLTGTRSYRDQTFVTTVEEYRGMTQAAAESAAAGMASDTLDANFNRTVVTANVRRANEACGYTIEKTTAYTSNWSAWSAWA